MLVLLVHDLQAKHAVTESSRLDCRRLEADPLFTSMYNEETYTKEGFKWVNTTEGLKDVLRRHHPELVGDWMTASSAFSLWNTPPEVPSSFPLYLRWGTGSPAAH